MYNYVTCDAIKCFWDCTGEAYGLDVRPVHPGAKKTAVRPGRTNGLYVQPVRTGSVY